jgi:hypothetical protein
LVWQQPLCGPHKVLGDTDVTFADHTVHCPYAEHNGCDRRARRKWQCNVSNAHNFSPRGWKWRRRWDYDNCAGDYNYDDHFNNRRGCHASFWINYGRTISV